MFSKGVALFWKEAQISGEVTSCFQCRGGRRIQSELVTISHDMRKDVFGAYANRKAPDQLAKLYEPVHDKTYNKTCVASKDSDQPVRPLSKARFLVHFSLDSLESVEGTCNQQRLIRLRGCAG